MECARVATTATLIADGGIKNAGDAVKALAAGADFSAVLYQDNGASPTQLGIRTFDANQFRALTGTFGNVEATFSPVTLTPGTVYYASLKATTLVIFLNSGMQGGGAAPYHWGRYRGLAKMLDRPPLAELIKDHVYFDTCVYHQAGIDLLTRVIPAENILFASEMLGAVKGVDPESGHEFDDTRRYIDASSLSAEKKQMIFEGNVRKVFPRAVKKLDALKAKTK